MPMIDQGRSIAIEMVTAIAGAIIELAKAHPEGYPAGHAYARMMTHGVTLEQFEAIVAGLVDAGRIVRRGDLLFRAKETKP